MRDLLRLGESNEDGRRWANACVMSGDCLRACDYGANPRFLLGVARATMEGQGALRPTCANAASMTKIPRKKLAAIIAPNTGHTNIAAWADRDDLRLFHAGSL